MSEAKIKNFFENLDEVNALMGNKEIVTFLDYDGTLTPIVDTPDLAVIAEDTKQLVNKLSANKSVAIVSGRATDDVSQKVGLDHLFYAGSHGFEIIDSQGNVTINEKAKQARANIEQVFKELSDLTRDINGALIEDVKYTVSAHYRLIADNDVDEFKQRVEGVVQKYPQLRITYGKRVFEVRPKIDWDKGKAVEWILDVLQFEPSNQIAIYIGDDTTDEDAFRILKDKGFGILVAENLRESHADFLVKNTDEVKEVLRFLIDKRS